MDTLETIRTLRSVRYFEPRSVPPESIQRILNAGRWSGSAKNTQPWRFIEIHERRTLDTLAEFGQGAKHLTRAQFGIAILTLASRRAEFDSGRCTQNMLLAAWNDGFGSCIASMHREAEARELLGVPDTFHVPMALSFGYPMAEYQRPPRKGGRLGLHEILHAEVWQAKRETQS